MRVYVALLTLILACSAAALAAPVLQVDEPVWNVDRIIVGSEHRRSLTVRNVGDEPLVIANVEQCCGFMGTLEKSTLLPGEATFLHLKLRQIMMVGEMRAEIYLISNDSKTPRFPVTALGKVAPRAQARAELVATSLDLGILQPGEAVSFEVRVRSTGNEGLRLTHIEKSRNIWEVATPTGIPQGEEGVLLFKFIADQSGPIEEFVTLSTNDPLQETLPFRLKGYVAKNWVPDRALVIYPVGQTIRYNPVLGSYQYNLVVENRGEKEVKLFSVESSLPVQIGSMQSAIDPKSKGGSDISFTISPNDPKPVTGTVTLQLLLPVEIR